MFYDNLKTACAKNGVKITPTVIMCGGTKGILGGWKKGASPNSDIVINLAKLLNTTTDFLLLGEDKENRYDSQNKIELTRLFDSLSEDKQEQILDYLKYIAQNYKK